MENWAVAAFSAIALLIGNQIVSSLRFFVVGRAFDLPACLARAHRVNLNSIAGALIFFNYFGQSMTRAALFAEHGAARSVMFLVTAIERALALAVLIGLGLAALLSVYGDGAVDWSASTGLALVAATIVAAVGIAFAVCFGPRARREALAACRGPLFGALVVAAALTLVMHLAMLCAYLCIAANVLGAPIDAALLLAAVLTMVGAAFPVAPGGWGAREATSVFAFSQLGGSIMEGVEIGATIGVLSVLALGANIGLVYMARIGVGAARPADLSSTGRAALRRLRAFCWLGPILVAMLAAFQAPLPVGDHFVTVNAADPLAIVVGLSALSVFLLGLARRDAWKPEYFALGLGLLAAAVAAAFLIGFARFGLTEWALVNRLTGTGVAFCFLLSGAFLTLSAGEAGVRRLVRALAVTLALIVAVEFTVRLAGFRPESLAWDFPTPVGFLANRNAWAFMLCAALGAYLAIENPRGARLWLAALLATAVILTASRAGFVALGAMLAYLAIVRRVEAVQMVAATAVTFVSIGVIEIAAPLVWAHVSALGVVGAPSGGGASASIASAKVATVLQHFDEIEPDRWASLIGGWRLFLEHPIFGAGLGAFMHEQIQSTGQPLVIHSTFLWLLAEFGVLGALMFLAPAILIMRQVFTDREWRDSPNAQALVAVFLVAGAFGLAHDMAYQRIVWLMIGMFAARPAGLRSMLRGRP